jgi:hypothetical protein
MTLTEEKNCSASLGMIQRGVDVVNDRKIPVISEVHKSRWYNQDTNVDSNSVR